MLLAIYENKGVGVLSVKPVQDTVSTNSSFV